MLSLVKICARPDCPTRRYFIGNTTPGLDIALRLRGTPCKDKWRSDWWKGHGKTLPQERKAGKAVMTFEREEEILRREIFD